MPVVALDLAPQMAEDESTRSDDEEPEKANAVRQAPSEDGACDEMKKGQDDDLLVVRSPAAGRQANNLKERREFHSDVERRMPREEARAFAVESAAYWRTHALLARIDERFENIEPTNTPLLIAVEGPSMAEVASPLVELPRDRIDALAEAA